MCDKSFSQKKTLNRHMFTHTKKKEHKCPEVGCGKEFKRPDTLSDHIRKKHTEKNQVLILCGVCCESFSSHAKLEEHMNGKHYGEKPHQCQFCDQRFAYKQGLDQHLRTVHDDTRNFSCPEQNCDKSFKTQTHLNNHLTSHKNTINDLLHQPQFSCQVCSEHFTRKDNMERHVAKCRPGPQSCDDCGRIFQDNRSLNKHHAYYRSRGSCVDEEHDEDEHTINQSDDMEVVEEKEEEGLVSL